MPKEAPTQETLNAKLLRQKTALQRPLLRRLDVDRVEADITNLAQHMSVSDSASAPKCSKRFSFLSSLRWLQQNRS